MNDERKYNKRMTSTKAEEDASCYYMNGHFKNVLSSRYCIKTQSKSAIEAKCHDYALAPQDVSQFCIIEGSSIHQ